MGLRCYVKTLLISGEVLMLKQYGVEIHGSRKWDPLPPEEEFFIPGRGGRGGGILTYLITLLDNNGKYSVYTGRGIHIIYS